MRFLRPAVVIALALVSVTVWNGTHVNAEGGALPNSIAEQGASAVSTGNGFNCFVQSGAVKCIGQNDAGQLGNGTNTLSRTVVQVSGLTSGVIQISSGDASTCALTSAGAVMCWGKNTLGELGNGTTTNSNVPVQVTGLTSGVARIDTKLETSCALMVDASVKCWGDNRTYATGSVTPDANADGVPDPVLTPTQVPGLSSGVASIALGGRQGTGNRNHGCAVMQDGTLRCWGNNESNELGSAVAGPVSPPVTVNVGDFVTAVTATGYSTCATTRSGAVKCWGGNTNGELGTGNLNPVPAGTFVSPLNVPADVVQMASSRSSTCAVTSAGALWCWGENFYQSIQRSASFTDTQPTPQIAFGLTTGVRAAARGISNLCILLVAGDLACSGYNFYSQTGDGYAGSIAEPTSVFTSAADHTPMPGFQSVSVLMYAACGQRTDGGIKCWGANNYRQLGSDELYAGLVPVDNTDIPAGTGVLGSLQGTQGATNCAVMNDSTVKCWGQNSGGMKGIGSSAADYSARTMLVSTGPDVPLTGVTQVTAGFSSVCVLASGGVKCVGDNNYGKLGDGTITSRLLPVQVSGLTSGVAQMSSGGTYHGCAVLTGGTVKCWGSGTSGQLGNGTLVSSNTPVSVSGITNAVSVTTAGLSSCALLSTAEVKCWGQNTLGQLGDGTTTNRSSPVTVSGITNAVSVVGSLNTMCALLSTGSIKCWGSGTSGQLGNSAMVDSLVPVTVTGITTATSVSTGYNTSCAVLVDTTVKCWGNPYTMGINIGNTHWYDGSTWLVRTLALPALPTVFTTTTTSTTSSTTSTTVAPAPVNASASTTSTTSTTVLAASTATTVPVIERVDDTVYSKPPANVGAGYVINAVSKSALSTHYLVTTTPKQCVAGGRSVFALSPGTCRILIRSLEDKNAFSVWSTVIKKEDAGVGSSVRESRAIVFGKLAEKPSARSLADLLRRIGSPSSAVVMGHTAILTGATPENLVLSEHRARNVAAALKKAAPHAQVGWAGLGGTVPLSRVLTEKAQAPNRRVVVYWVP